MIPVDVVPRVSAGRLVIGFWIGQSWPQHDFVTTILLRVSVVIWDDVIVTQSSRDY